MEWTTMKEFDIQLPKKPSALAGVTEALGQNGVNIRGISSDLEADKIYVKIVTDDEASTRSILSMQGAPFSEREVLSVVIHDRPGEIAKLARRLARRMITIESMYMLSRGGGKTEVAFTADDMDKAAEALRAWK
jgi:hypothetical protein